MHITPSPANEPSLTEHGEHDHGLDTLVGYSIVRTSWTGAMVNVQRVEVQRVQGAHRYAEAVAQKNRLLRQLADPSHTHFVVDSLYECGCRSDRIDASEATA